MRRLKFALMQRDLHCSRVHAAVTSLPCLWWDTGSDSLRLNSVYQIYTNRIAFAVALGEQFFKNRESHLLKLIFPPTCKYEP